MNNQHRDDVPTSVYTIESNNHLVAVKSGNTQLRRRGFCKRCLIVSGILFFFFAIVCVITAGLCDYKKEDHVVCDSESCLRIAASLKESMDTSVDPCDDFYKYTCGRWADQHPVPDSGLSNTWFDERQDRMAFKIRKLLRDNFTSHGMPYTVQQAKIFYESCLDLESIYEAGLKPLQSLLTTLKLPQVPVALKKDNEESNHYLVQLARLKKHLGKDLFFGAEVYSDPRNNSRNIIILDIPDTESILPSNKDIDKRIEKMKQRWLKLNAEESEDENYLEDKDESSPEKEFMMGAFKELISNGRYNVCSAWNVSVYPREEDITRVINKVYDLIEDLHFIVFEVKNSTNATADETIEDSDYMHVDQLQNLTDSYIMEMNDTLKPKIIWKPFLEELFRDVVSVDLNGRDKILVGDIDYLSKVALYLSEADDEDLESVIWWSVIDSMIPFSSKKLRELWFKYVESLTNVEARQPRSLICSHNVNYMLGMATSWLFIDPKAESEKAQKVAEMLKNIKAAFDNLITNADWMDDETKGATLEKSRAMISAIGYPPWLFDEEKLNDYYKGLDLGNSSYFDNLVQIAELKVKKELSKLHDHNKHNASDPEWPTDPTDVNAFHSFQDNQITIPAAILQFPFHDLGLEVLNYGAIGSIIGHELTHGFDNSGRHYDSRGNFRQWWSNDTAEEYNQRANCFVDSYGQYYEEEVDQYVDGSLTLGENIADNGGLRESFYAYKIWMMEHGEESPLSGFLGMTEEQLFFFSYAHIWCESYTKAALLWSLEDSHCPGHVRLMETLRNSAEFSEAFNCPVGSSMNPEKKCRLF